MKANDSLRYILSFLVFVMLQVLWVKYFILWDTAMCFLYIAFLLIMPVSLPAPILMVIAFLTGLFVDLFYDTTGINTAAAVAMMYARPYIIRVLTPLGGYDDVIDISITSMGIRWFVTYVFIMTFIYALLVFVIEAYGLSYFYWTLVKVIATTIFTTFMICSFQYLFFTPTK